MKLISEQDIINLQISPGECVSWIKESFSIKFSSQLPVKESVHPQGLDFFTSMPCLLSVPGDGKNTLKGHYYGVKVVHRIEGAVPSLGSDIMLYAADRGELVALLDGNWITAMRTGAVAAASALALQKSKTDSYGFIGLGNTARATLLCLLSIVSGPIKVKLLRYKDQADQFIERFQDNSNIIFEIVDNINELSGCVDVLFSCVTSASGLMVEDEKMFRPGITLIPVHTRGFQNCDTTFDRVFGDDTAHVRGFRYFNQFHDYNEIGEVFAGRDPGRKSETQRILSYSYGLAIHDVYFSGKIYEKLKDRVSVDSISIVKKSDKFWV